jgi:hypothetical protein
MKNIKSSSAEVLEILTDIAENNRESGRKFSDRIDPEIDEECAPKLAFIFKQSGLNPHSADDWQLIAVALSQYFEFKGMPRVWVDSEKNDLLERISDLKLHSNMSIVEATDHLVKKGQPFQTSTSRNLEMRYYEARRWLIEEIDEGRATPRQIEILEILGARKKQNSRLPA